MHLFKLNLAVALLTCAAAVPLNCIAAGDDEINNTLSFSAGFYNDTPLIGEDRPQISALSFESEVFLDLSDRFSVTFQPYLQYEHLSDDNLHMDLRKFLFRYSGEQWELRAGIGQEFWGVTESRNVVDTINQSDFAADFSGDTKLGQPMVQLTGFSDFGDFSLYILPRFREPTYASADSRPRLPFVINEDLTTFESAEEDTNPDYALRWSGNISVWDIGVHYFNGTRREPLIVPTDDGLTSRFQLVEQLGVDAQLTVDALLAKLEWIQQAGIEVENHAELVAGLEYTLSQVFGSEIDIGLLSEILYDSRQESADHLFQNDLMTGVRLAFNDTNAMQVLLTLITDLDNNGKVIRFDFDSRIGPNFTVGLAGRWWRDTEDDAVLSTLSTENNMQFRINWFF